MSTQTEKPVIALAEKVAMSWNQKSPEKANKFFADQIKEQEADIEELENQKGVVKSQYKREDGKLDRKIEDAEQDVKDAYLAVKEKHISSNEAATMFAKQYWTNIELKESKLATLVEKKEIAKKANEDTKKAISDQIKLRRQRIAVIKGE